MYFCLDTEHGFERGYKLFLFFCNLSQIIGEHFLGHLHVYVKGIGVVYAVNNDLVIRRHAFVQKDRFNLRREYIDAADNEHIVASAHGLSHLDMRPAAGAGLSRENA